MIKLINKRIKLLDMNEREVHIGKKVIFVCDTNQAPLGLASGIVSDIKFSSGEIILDTTDNMNPHLGKDIVYKGAFLISRT